jgi:hypothetical protein
MERYDAMEMAKINVMLAPWHAFVMAAMMKRLLIADVDRAMHVATVNGLKRKLLQSVLVFVNAAEEMGTPRPRQHCSI